LPPPAITSATAFVLTNAVYLNAAWQYPFDKSTTSAPFTTLDGSTVSAPIMVESDGTLGYATSADYTAVDLPYDGGELAMTIVQPTNFATFETGLNRTVYQAIESALQPNGVVLTMPKLTTTSAFSVKDALTALGMSDAFDPTRADFSAMDGQKDLLISDVLHQSYVGINEQGTIAAAATAVVGVGSSAHVTTVTVTIDHPFFFFIRDIGTGTILFVGRIADPTAM
jgi:serpin B